MKQHSQFDFWYAVNNTEILLAPENRLETFGTTVVNYHLISELMDDPARIRIRSGILKAAKPEIITPHLLPDQSLDGFGDAARRYYEWIRDHADELKILKYGFTIRKQELNEEIVTDSLKAVIERVTEDVLRKNDPLSAILLGVDQPWEVCLLKLMVELVQKSSSNNLHDLRAAEKRSLRDEIESAFLQAARDSSKISGLAELLKRRGLFEKMQDRFFALVRASERKK